MLPFPLFGSVFGFKAADQPAAAPKLQGMRFDKLLHNLDRLVVASAFDLGGANEMTVKANGINSIPDYVCHARAAHAAKRYFKEGRSLFKGCEDRLSMLSPVRNAFEALESDKLSLNAMAARLYDDSVITRMGNNGRRRRLRGHWR